MTFIACWKEKIAICMMILFFARCVDRVIEHDNKQGLTESSTLYVEPVGSIGCERRLSGICDELITHRRIWKLEEVKTKTIILSKDQCKCGLFPIDLYCLDHLHADLAQTRNILFLDSVFFNTSMFLKRTYSTWSVKRAIQTKETS